MIGRSKSALKHSRRLSLGRRPASNSARDRCPEALVHCHRGVSTADHSSSRMLAIAELKHGYRANRALERNIFRVPTCNQLKFTNGERAGEQLQQPQLLLAMAHQHDRADRSEVIETGEEHHRKLQWAQSQ